MAIHHILKYPDKRLRTIASPVTSFDDALKRLIDDMFETMYDDDGAGLAATQINIHQRVLVIDLSRNRSRPMTFINPEIVESSGTLCGEEGCLSLPGVYAPVKRAASVRVTYQDITGQSHEFTSGESDRLTVAIQHELDHLNGILYVDRLSPLRQKMLIKRYNKVNEHDNQL
jgi:peptide deformylase